jgi:hypothetical protein
VRDVDPVGAGIGFFAQILQLSKNPPRRFFFCRNKSDAAGRTGEHPRGRHGATPRRSGRSTSLAQFCFGCAPELVLKISSGRRFITGPWYPAVARRPLAAEPVPSESSAAGSASPHAELVQKETEEPAAISKLHAEATEGRWHHKERSDLRAISRPVPELQI